MAGFLPMWSPINSNISDGSNLWDTAIKSQARAADMLNSAVDTIRTNQQNSANAALLQAYQKALANGATPDEARASAAAVVNPFTTAAALNDMFQTSRNDIYSNIQKTQEDRTAKDWQGQNEAANINALAAEAFRLRNTKAFNNAMAQGNSLDPVAKKFLKYEDLVHQNLADDTDKLNLEKGKLDMANTRQAMAERARRAQLEEQQLQGLDLIAKTNAVMAEKGQDPKSATYGALYRDTLNQIAASKGIKDPTYFVARFAPDYLPYIKEGNIYDKGVNLAPSAQSTVDTEVQALDNATNFTDDGKEDISMARGMAKKGAVLSASRAQAIKLAAKESDIKLTKEEEAKLANLAQNPNATSQDFNNLLNSITASHINDNNPRNQVGYSSMIPLWEMGIDFHDSVVSGLNSLIGTNIKPIVNPTTESSIGNFKFIDTGSGIESTAKTKTAQNAINSFMTNINAANDAYNQKVKDSKFLQNNVTLAKDMAFNVDPALITTENGIYLKTQLDAADTVYQNQIDDTLKNYDSVLAKLGNAKTNFNPLESAIKASANDYKQTEEQLSKQLNYDSVPEFRKKYTKAYNFAKELGASDAGARIAIQMLIDQGKWESSTFTPDWRDNNLAAAVKTVNDIEAKSPGILTRVSNITLAQTRNDLIKQMIKAKKAGDVDVAKKLQQRLQMTYLGGAYSTPASTNN